MKDFLEDYRDYIDAFYIEFLDYMQHLGWNSEKSRERREYIFGTGFSWRLSVKFVKDLLDFSQWHWIDLLEIMKGKGYAPCSTLTKMVEAHEIGSTLPWWKKPAPIKQTKSR